MQDWLAQQIDTNFTAFKGARLTGSIPLRESLLNELLAAGLRAAQSPATRKPAADLSRFAALVSSARVEVGEGAVTLHFELNV